nr:hypothetical protein [Mycolicibacterium sp. P1-5]
MLGGRPVGMVAAYQETPEAVYVYSLWLEPEARGHGLAVPTRGTHRDAADGPRQCGGTNGLRRPGIHRGAHRRRQIRSGDATHAPVRSGRYLASWVRRVSIDSTARSPSTAWIANTAQYS